MSEPYRTPEVTPWQEPANYGSSQAGVPQSEVPQSGMFQTGAPVPSMVGSQVPAHPGLTVAPPRPGKVTASAVFAFIISGFSVLAIVGLSVLLDASNVYFALIALAMVSLAMYLVGGIMALTGKDGRWLVGAAVLSLVLEVVSLVLDGAEDFVQGALIRVGFPILILVFMLRSESKLWFKAKGGKTF